MARCWTCGSSVSGHHYRCSSCENVIRELEGLHETISGGLEELARIQQDGFNQLSNQLSEIVTVLEWGFGELSWQLQQQTDVLRSIDHTLQTPSETQANEWRLHAEELRRRGVLDESEEFFLKALNEYRLDYRIYVGLAETYLQGNLFDKAKTYLEKSFPHAPKEEIDYKSYSYRLLGHIYECEENYIKALEALHSSIKLSPDYADGLYDFAQCASLVDDDVIDRVCSQTFQQWGHDWQRAVELRDYNLICHLALSKAIKARPVYFYLTSREKNFERRKEAVQLALKNLLDNAQGRVGSIIANTERVSEEVEKLIPAAQRALRKSREKKELESRGIYEDAKLKLILSKHKLATGDYTAILDAKLIADEAYGLANKARDKADEERKDYAFINEQKVKDALNKTPCKVILGAVGGGIVGSIFGIIIGVVLLFVLFGNSKNEPAKYCAIIRLSVKYSCILGMIFGVIGAVYDTWKWKIGKVGDWVTYGKINKFR